MIFCMVRLIRLLLNDQTSILVFLFIKIDLFRFDLVHLQILSPNQGLMLIGNTFNQLLKINNLDSKI